MAQKIGYARVSTQEQNLDTQLHLLELAGCDTIFKDHGVSGGDMSRPGLDQALETLKKGDHLVVWRLDRLGRSLSGVIQTVDNLAKQNVEFRSLTEGFDTSSITGTLIFHIIAALAEFERNLISERTKVGLAAAARNGKRLGRPPRLTKEQLQLIKEAAAKGKVDYGSFAEQFGVSTRTIYRATQNE